MLWLQSSGDLIISHFSVVDLQNDHICVVIATSLPLPGTHAVVMATCTYNGKRHYMELCHVTLTVDDILKGACPLLQFSSCNVIVFVN